jgi:hypothetical protein
MTAVSCKACGTRLESPSFGECLMFELYHTCQNNPTSQMDRMIAEARR